MRQGRLTFLEQEGYQCDGVIAIPSIVSKIVKRVKVEKLRFELRSLKNRTLSFVDVPTLKEIDDTRY